MSISIKFEQNQNYQLEAIDAVVSLFHGHSRVPNADAFISDEQVNEERGELFHEMVYPNHLNILRDNLIENLK